MNDLNTLRMLARYKQWSNDVTYTAVCNLPEGEALKPRKTNFGNMVRTLNHIYVVDRIFQAHIEGRAHGYRARNTEATPELETLRANQQEIDQWYVDFADGLDETGLAKPVKFTFIDGGEGKMTQGEIILHLVNHGTYHRGFVADMMNQIGVVPKASDITVFTQLKTQAQSSASSTMDRPA